MFCNVRMAAMEYLPRVLLGEPICCWMFVISNIRCFHMFSLPLRVMELLTPVIHFCTMLWHQPDMISGCRGFAHWTFGVWTHRFSTRNKEREHEVRWSKESACSKMNMSPCLFVKQNCSCTANNQMLMCTQNYVGGCLSGVMWTSFILQFTGTPPEPDIRGCLWIGMLADSQYLVWKSRWKVFSKKKSLIPFKTI